MSGSDYDKVAQTVLDYYNQSKWDKVGMNVNDRASFAGCIVRLAGHDFMDFRLERDKSGNIVKGKSTGGSDGCMSFEDGDNKGLAKCVQKFELDKAYKKHCKKVSLADYLVIAAEAVMAEASVKPIGYNEKYKYNYELGLAKKLRDGFKFGRVTNEECDAESMKHRMPNPEHGCSAENGLEWIFNNNIYFGSGAPWSYTAAISGTHTLGKANPDNSGYDGFWSDEHNQGWFNADYFRSIIIKGWGPELNISPNKN